MKNTLLFVSIFLSLSLHAQKPPIKFGDVSVDDLKMTTYAQDSSAEAVVLGDFGESKLEYNKTKESFQVMFERTRRLKILRKEGLEWANLNIPLYHNTSDEEKLTNLKAVTYNLENAKIVETKAKSESILKEKADDNLNLVKVTWPNVKVGSIIEVTYRVTSDFIFNFQDWDFQETIPTAWSEYRVTIPEYFNYEKYVQGYVGLAINESKTSSGSITITSSGESRFG